MKPTIATLDSGIQIINVPVPYTKEEVQEKIQQLSNNLKSSQSMIDNLTTQLTKLNDDLAVWQAYEAQFEQISISPVQPAL